MSETDPTPTPQPAAATGRLASLVGEDFDVMAAMGGWRGLVESVAPGLVFVVVYVVTGQEMVPALIAALVAAVLAMVIRLVQRSPLTQAASGVLGVLVGVVWAWTTGRAENYFLAGLWANAGYAAVFLISIVVRWPLVGVIAALLRGEKEWRTDRAFYRRAAWATWLWTAMFIVRLVVQVPLYLGGDVPWLGTWKLVMGLPLFAIVAYFSWLLLRRRAHSPEPGDPPES